MENDMEESVPYHQAAGTVKPVRLPPLLCSHCSVCTVPRVAHGAGQHVARAVCSNPDCGRFLKWLPKALFAQEAPRMGSVNRVILVGTITNYGVTVKYAPTGTPCAAFALELREQDRDGKVHTLFQDCEVWGRRAEAASELEAGQLCLFEGKLAKRKRGETWDTVVSGFDLTPLLAPQASLTGSTN
jgi:primosomal replication protein N